MARTDVEVLVIGGGPAGLAVSWELSQRAVEHLVVERGRVGESWRTRRWDSFHLVTPNWCFQLPGRREPAVDRDGFMTACDLVCELERYRCDGSVPLREGLEVSGLRSSDGGFVAESDAGSFRAQAVVVATGPYQQVRVPRFARAIDARIVQLRSDEYRRPEQLPAGGVLVVGSGQSGVQIADELRGADRDVWLSLGSCGWVPRRYRDRDIAAWLVEMGMLDRTVDSLPAPQNRFACFPQLSGRNGGDDLNIHSLAEAGVWLIGRICGADRGGLLVADDVQRNIDAADAFAVRVKESIDAYARRTDHNSEESGWPALDRVTRSRTIATHVTGLEHEQISSIVWACGYRTNFGWLHVPVFDRDGFPRHRRGCTDVPGLYFLGLPWLHKWKSATLLGVGADAAYLADQIATRRSAPAHRSEAS